MVLKKTEKHSRTQVSVSAGQHSNNYTNVSLHMHSLACKEHLGVEGRIGNYDSRQSV